MNPSFQVIPKSRKKKRSGSKGNVRRGATGGGMMKKNEGIRIVERKRLREMIKQNTFFPRRFELTFEFQRG